MIKKLRKEHQWTQEEVAGMLGVSRVTYNLIENGKTPWDPYIENLQDIFDVSFSAIDKQEQQPIKRILDEATYQKTRDLILYILEKTVQLPNVGKTVIYKMLYFCEFDLYELTWQRLTGMDFVKLPKGPAPAGFDFAIKKMIEENALVPVNAKYMWYIQQRYLINEKTTHDLRDQKTKDIIDRIISRLKDMNATEISEYSHGDLPWKATPDMELIDIELACHRSYPYSAKIKQEKLEADIAQMRASRAFDFLADEPDLYDHLI